MFGTAGRLGVLDGALADRFADGVLAGVWIGSDVVLLIAANAVPVGGVGKTGDIERAVIDAECAWYSRIGCSDGTLSVCCT